MSEKKLNAKHEKFCQEYMKDFNGAQAAIRAGYAEKSARVTASKLLTNPNIISRVRALQDEMLERLPVSIYYVLQGYIEVYERCMQHKEVMAWDYNEKKYMPTGEYTFDSKGAMSALDSMGKYLQMFVEKKEVKVNTETTDKLASILNQLNSDDG